MNLGKINIYELTDYKECVSGLLDANAGVRGIKTALARHMKCQSSVVSQVLHKPDRHFTDAQVYAVGMFFALNEDEISYLLLLLARARSGSAEIEAFYDEMIAKRRLGRQRISASTSFKELEPPSHEALAVFHSHWYYYAIYSVLGQQPNCSVPEVAALLAIGEEVVARAIQVLEEIGFIRENPEYLASPESETPRFSVNSWAIGVPRASNYVDLVHRNFRLEAVRSLDRRRVEDAHYSRFVVAPEDEIPIIQEKIASFAMDFNNYVDRPMTSKKKSLLTGFCIDYFCY